jgi:hypothetical protein
MKKLILVFALIAITNVLAQTNNGISITQFATGMSDPVELTNAKDDRLFVVERGGGIRIITPSGSILSTPFLNIPNLITTANVEQGLLGLAFHPNYKSNGLFYINYSAAGSGNTVIAKYTVSSSDSNVANPSGTILLTINQPFSNHNGGTLKFGSDNYLYIGMGDGGSGGDPLNAGQDSTTRLGKMLRIDVDTISGYKIPTTNPYVNSTTVPKEIWAFGLRNPWKFSFDRLNGDIWIADVGQNAFEEVSTANAGQGNLNYGWRCYEGNSAYNLASCPPFSNFKAPLLSLNHNNSGFCSITGGYVYRGSVYNDLFGKYLFADYCNPVIGIISDTLGNASYSQTFTGKYFSSFGEDQNGELYIVDYVGGKIFKIGSTLGLNDLSSEAFKIYPIPAKSKIHIKSKTSELATSLEIYNIYGQLVQSDFINGDESIDISKLASGIFTIRIKSISGKYSYQKLVIE